MIRAVFGAAMAVMVCGTAAAAKSNICEDRLTACMNSDRSPRECGDELKQCIRENPESVRQTLREHPELMQHESVQQTLRDHPELMPQSSSRLTPNTDETPSRSTFVSLNCLRFEPRETNMSSGHGHYWNNFAIPSGAYGCPSSFFLHYREPDGTVDVWAVGRGTGAFVTEGGPAAVVSLSTEP